MAVAIPLNLCSRLEDFCPLSLSGQEKDILRQLHSFALKERIEYGRALCGDMDSSPFTSGQFNRVRIPPDVMSWQEISFYHSHTNESALSSQDFSLLTNGNVKKVCVITISRYVFSVCAPSDDRPGIDEFLMEANSISRQVDNELIYTDGFDQLNPDERTTLAAWEQSFQIARHFKWRLEGGKL